MANFRRVVRAARLQDECDRWNAANPVGVAVDYTDDLGKVTATKTRSEAYVLSGHSCVVFLEGKSGCYALERVRRVDVNTKDQ
jgi:hypothetical protein